MLINISLILRKSLKLRNADSVNDLRLQLKLNSRHAKKGDFFQGADELAMEAIDDYTPKM